MSKNKIFIFFVVSFFVGIFFSNFLFDFKLIIIFESIFLMFLLLILFSMKKHHFFVFVISIGIFIGGTYSGINNYFISQNISQIKNYYGKTVYIKAEIDNLYKKSLNTNSYISNIVIFDGQSGLKFKFLLYTQKNIILKKGQLVGINSKVDKIDNFTDNFNYEKYMQSKNIYFSVFSNNIEFIGNNKLSKFSNFVVDFRQKLIEIIFEIYPKNEAVFLAGILIGATEDMDKNIQTSFANSGLTHLVAVSGFNITIIIIFLGFLFKFFPIILRTCLIVFFIIFFIFIVGDNVAVLRAGIMGLVGYFILVSGRKTDSLSLLLFTAFLMTLYNPLYLNYDISFHLSFLAVLGLLYFQNFWSNVFKFIPSFFAIRESFVLTMSALTTTIPIMIFNFGQVSILSPIANMLVGGIIPFAMFFGFLSILGQLIYSKIGFLFGYINFFLLKYVILVADFFGNLSFSVFKMDFGIYGVYLELIYFMILIFLIIYFKQKKGTEFKAEN